MRRYIRNNTENPLTRSYIYILHIFFTRANILHKSVCGGTYLLEKREICRPPPPRRRHNVERIAPAHLMRRCQQFCHKSSRIMLNAPPPQRVFQCTFVHSNASPSLYCTHIQIYSFTWNLSICAHIYRLR